MALNRAQKQFHRTLSRPAPVAGLNVRDALTEMQPSDCVVMKNWIPFPHGPRVRKGWREWATDMGDLPIQSLLVYYASGDVPITGPSSAAPTSVTGQMFAVDRDDIYDVSSAGATPTSVRAMGGADASGIVSHAMFTTVGGSFMVCCSEADGYFYYNGTTWTTPAMGGGAGQIANVDPADLAFVFPWKHRLYFIERDTQNIWYLPTGQITGAATLFPTGELLKHGGPLSLMGNWTIDAGEGIDDFLVIVSERGDLLLYKGISLASTPSLVGTWYIGEMPKGRRGALQYGGDLLLLCNNGLFPVSYVTRGGAGLLMASESDYTSKIQELISEVLSTSYNLYGWQMEFYVKDGILVICAPNHNEVLNRQFVMSVTKNAWCIFDSIPVQCLGQSSGYLFAGTPDGRVIIMQDGFFDNVPLGESAGDGIVGEIQPAFEYFEKPGQLKNFLMVRPTFLSVDNPGLTLQMNTDFSFVGPAGTPSFPPPTGSRWDVALWDVGKWAGGQITFQKWITVSGQGYAGSLNIKTVSAGDTQLASIDYMLEDGGPV